MRCMVWAVPVGTRTSTRRGLSPVCFFHFESRYCWLTIFRAGFSHTIENSVTRTVSIAVARSADDANLRLLVAQPCTD